VNALPERLQGSIGGHFGASFSVELDGVESITYRRTKRREKDPWEIGSSEEWETKSEQIRPTPAPWAAFRTALDRLNVWSWQADYPNPGVCDGTSWSVEITYPDREIVSGGSNCFPGVSGKAFAITDRPKDNTFATFCRAVSVLTGREFR
jgi:hypothetical protein